MGFKDIGIPQETMNTYGDTMYRGTDLAVRLPPAPSVGVPTNPATGLQFMHFNQATQQPEWSDMQQLLGKYFAFIGFYIPSILGITYAIAEKHSGGSSSPSKSQSIPAVPSISKTVPTPTVAAIGGAFAHIESPLSDTDETTAANNATVNDMHLSGGAATPAVTDGYELGYASLWDGLAITVGTAGVGTYTITWKYWSGAAWTAFTANNLIYYDEINGWLSTGKKHIAWQRPSDWATKIIGGLTLYFIKAEITSYTSMTTKPLGTQAFINILT